VQYNLSSRLLGRERTRGIAQFLELNATSIAINSPFTMTGQPGAGKPKATAQPIC
jgi:hypothetical protein